MCDESRGASAVYVVHSMWCTLRCAIYAMQSLSVVHSMWYNLCGVRYVVQSMRCDCNDMTLLCFSLVPPSNYFGFGWWRRAEEGAAQSMSKASKMIEQQQRRACDWVPSTRAPANQFPRNEHALFNLVKTVFCFQNHSKQGPRTLMG